MQNNALLSGWIPPESRTQRRRERSQAAELLANAGAAHQFNTMMDQICRQAPTMQTDARTAAVTCAIAAAQAEREATILLEMLEEMGSGLNAESDRETAAGALETAAAADHMVEEAITKLHPMFGHAAGPWEDQTADAGRRIRAEERGGDRENARAVAALGHMNALNWHLDETARLEIDQPENWSERISGHVLAMWVREQGLTCTAEQSTEPPALTERACHMWGEVQDKLHTPENTQRIERHRPLTVTSAAEGNLMIEELLPLLHGRGPDCDAVFNWSEQQESADAVMAYRFNGYTRVKLLQEPYDHPIDRQTAMEHCESLDQVVLEETDQWGQEADSPAADRLLHQNMIMRGLILANLHCVEPALLDLLVEEFRQVSSERTRIRAALATLAQGYAETVRALSMRYGLEGADMSERQVRAAVVAARQEGADESALRDMIALLTGRTDQMEELGVPASAPTPPGRTERIERLINALPGSADLERIRYIMLGPGQGRRRGETE